MLHIGLVIFAAVLVAVGTFLCIVHVVPAGIQALGLGVVLLFAGLFERWRYNNKNALRAGDWRRTGERFIDPTSGKEVEVLYDPRSGERRYQDTDSD
jgi:hypothetical protein